jgi:hypothetical protein
MHQFMMTVVALAALGAVAATAQADDLRAAPKRNDGQCLRYSPGQLREGRFGSRADCPQPSKLARPSEPVSALATCTQLKSACLSLSEAPYYGVPRFQKPFCDSTWEQCMKTGWWEGKLIHRSVERR